MCGIVGFTGKTQAAGFLLEGLERLEYRGYDSAGIAVLNDNNLTVCKTTERIKNLTEKNERRQGYTRHHRHRSHPLGDSRRPVG